MPTQDDGTRFQPYASGKRREDAWWAVTKEVIHALWDGPGSVMEQNSWGAQRNVMSGYGLGGQRASLAHQWLIHTIGVRKEFLRTYTFNAPGTQCLVEFSNIPFLNHMRRKGLKDDIGEPRFTVDSHDNIWNYHHAVALMALIDYPVGRTCPILGSMENANDEGRQHCEKAIQFRGTDSDIGIRRFSHFKGADSLCETKILLLGLPRYRFTGGRPA